MDNLLSTLKTEEIKAIKYVTLNKEQILFNEGDICESIGIVISGEIEITSYSYNGKEIIYNHLTPSMVFGNNLIFSSDPHYKGSIIAKSTAKVALNYKKTLISLLKSNEEFMLNYLKIQSDTGKELNAKIKLLAIDNAEERFLYFMHQNGGQIRYKTITLLASSLHLQRETLSRLLSRLENEKKIIKKEHLIKLV